MSETIRPPDPEPGPPPPAPSRVLGAVARCLLLLGAFGLAFVPLRGSQDEWWHLKTGQWIWEHGGLPLNDIFTYTGENLRWYNHEWLSQVIFYGVYRLGEGLPGGGLSWFIGFKAVIIGTVFMLVAMLARQRLAAGCNGWSLPCVIALVGADISRRTIHPRPPIFSYLLMAVFLLVLYSWKQRRLGTAMLWWLVPLTVLWANLHGMVLLSIVTLGAFAGGEILENCGRWFRRKKSYGASLVQTVVTRRVLLLSALTAAVAVACMAQPSGYHIFLLGRNFTADPLLQNIILEMSPTPRPFGLLRPDAPWWQAGNLVAQPAGFWTFWVALAILAVLLVRNRFRLPYGADYLLVGFFTYQAVMHWRLLPLFAIAAAAPVASLAGARLLTWRPRTLRVQEPLFILMLAGLVGWFNFTVAEPPPQTFFRRNMAMLRGEAFNYSDYPAPLMDYIVKADLPDRMFTDSNYCGYAMWRLSPEHHKLFTDNRFDLFGSEFIRQERVVMFALNDGDRIDGETVTEGWQELLDKYGVNFLVFRPIDRPHLFGAIKVSPAWRMVYYYIAPEAAPRHWPLEGYYVFVRQAAGGDEIAARSETIFRRQFPHWPTPAEVWKLIQRR